MNSEVVLGGMLVEYAGARWNVEWVRCGVKGVGCGVRGAGDRVGEGACGEIDLGWLACHAVGSGVFGACCVDGHPSCGLCGVWCVGQTVMWAVWCVGHPSRGKCGVWCLRCGEPVMWALWCVECGAGGVECGACLPLGMFPRSSSICTQNPNPQTPITTRQVSEVVQQLHRHQQVDVVPQSVHPALPRHDQRGVPVSQAVYIQLQRGAEVQQQHGHIAVGGAGLGLGLALLCRG